MIYVTNRKRWNRTKGWVAFACWIIAMLAVGFDDQSTDYQPNYQLAIIMLACCTGLITSIYRRR